MTPIVVNTPEPAHALNNNWVANGTAPVQQQPVQMAEQKKIIKNGLFACCPFPSTKRLFRANGVVVPMPKAAVNGATKQQSSNLTAFEEHQWSLERIAGHFGESRINMAKLASSLGLPQHRAGQLLEQNGPNTLPKPKEMSALRLFVNQFLNLLWALLAVAAALSVADFINSRDPTSLWVGLVIYVMIFVVCSVSFYQEREAQKVVAGFKNLLPQSSNVIRDGNETTVAAELLVVGDLIKIKSGLKVPADARILSCSQLKLETSSITGESEPIEFRADPAGLNVTIFESQNVAFNGSYCVEGEGLAVVIRTGTDTVIGKIAGLTTDQANKPSRLQRQINSFVKFLTILASTMGLSVFVAGIVIHEKWESWVFVLATAFSICAMASVPEGMPITVTSILTLVARRLAHKNVYLKKLDIAEALGSANIIASDKTGTLTKNEMTITDVWYSNEYISKLLTETIANRPRSVSVLSSPLKELVLAMSVCNTSSFDNSKSHEKEENGHKSVAIPIEPSNGINGIEKELNQRAVGAPSEVAMIKYAQQVVNVHELRHRYNVVFEIPFNSKRKFHAVICKIANSFDEEGNQNFLLLMKGAPEILIARCGTILRAHGEGVAALDTERMEEFQKAYDTFGESGRRVIGFAQKQFSAELGTVFSVEENNFPQEGLVFIGVSAIMDPPRNETKGAITECKCKLAGIKVFMVTGDHHLTATAIAKQIGLIEPHEGGPDSLEVIKGADIPALSQQQWDRIVEKKGLVFARTTPEQKLLIVQECQKRGQIIAMTGDGVNDAPALKRSDIGVGMGSGSDVAKQAADIVLTDDNFASIVHAVEEGRLMFDNIKKLLVYLCAHATPELWALIIYFCFGMPIGTTALIILSVDLVTEIPPGIAMCMEPAEGDLMNMPPRRPGKGLISTPLLAYCYLYTGQLIALGSFCSYVAVISAAQSSQSHNINISDLWMSAKDAWQKDGDDFTSNGRTFTEEEQLYIGRQACSAWQIGIVFGQVFHVFSCRTLRQSMFSMGFLSNKFTIGAAIIETFLLILSVYCPGLNKFLGGAPVPWFCWLIVACFGVFIFFFNEFRKWSVRHAWPNPSLAYCFSF